MKKNKTCGPRFRILLKELQITTTRFSEFLGISDPQTVHNWYTRGVPDYRMEDVARRLSVNTEWLKTGEGPQDARALHLVDASGNTFDAQSIRGTYRVIDPVDIELPFYKEAATAPGSDKNHVIKDPSESIRLPRNDLDSLEINHADAICARMVGNSMAEKIEDGSIVAIDRHPVAGSRGGTRRAAGDERPPGDHQQNGAGAEQRAVDPAGSGRWIAHGAAPSRRGRS